MNDLVLEMATLQEQIKNLEAEAVKHEDAARECRAKRAEAKTSLSKLQATIENARIVHAVNGSLAAAQAAEAAARAAESAANAKLAQIDAKLAELDARAAAPKE